MNALAETPLYAPDVMRLLRITHANTLRLHIKVGKIPPPDVKLTQKTRYWHRSTLERHGLLASPAAGVSPSGISQSAQA